MDRRQFLVAVPCGSLLPSLASAQEPGRVYRIAVISPAETAVGMFRNFQLPELARLGFVVGRNLTLTTHFGPPALMPELARQAIATKPDVVVAVSTVAILAVILNIILDSVVGALARGDILQVLLFAILFGFALMALGELGHKLRGIIDDTAHAVFGVIAIVMKAAPIGAFGAMAYTIGKFGPAALGNLIGLIVLFYATAALFVFGVLGLIARFVGFNIFKFITYIKDELLIVLGTSSSESALPQLMAKLERLGCSKSVVGLVVPTGYSFNLDGTNIYMTLATLFIAQALGVDLTFSQQLTILVVAMLTSKGASGVTGAGFITLAATLAVVSPALVPGMAIVFSVDKFMSEVRALTNITGNGIATVFVSWWEGELDHDRLHAALNKAIDPSDVETAVTTG